MKNYYKFKHWLKLGRWKMRRTATSLRWGADKLINSPIVLGNAMPKSGSHLIIQVLQGLTQLGPFVNPGFPPVNRLEDNSKLPDAMVLANLKRMHPGDIAYGYVNARDPFTALLAEPDRATVFVYRDPRDMIISHVFYASQMHAGHGMYKYYNETLNTMEERINAAIQGVDKIGSELSPIQKKYENYIGWLEQPAVLSLRFEDLILDQQVALGCLLDYLCDRGFSPDMERSHAIRILQEAIAPHRSGTFRKGKPGNWQEYFTEKNKAFFKDNTADLLLRLGYEQDSNW